MPASDELGRLPSLVYNFRTRGWGSLDAEQRQGQAAVWQQDPPPITPQTLDAVAPKGRGSHERDAWGHASPGPESSEVVRYIQPGPGQQHLAHDACPALLLREPGLTTDYTYPHQEDHAPWQITPDVEFATVERMVIVLVGFLQHHTPVRGSEHEWCVGGSILATYSRRNAEGVSDEMHMVLCRRIRPEHVNVACGRSIGSQLCWAGNIEKVGNSCQECCQEGIVRTHSICRNLSCYAPGTLQRESVLLHGAPEGFHCQLNTYTYRTCILSAQ